MLNTFFILFDLRFICFLSNNLFLFIFDGLMSNLYFFIDLIWLYSLFLANYTFVKNMLGREFDEMFYFFDLIHPKLDKAIVFESHPNYFGSLDNL